MRSLNGHAFCYCRKLEYINIPASVTYIGDSTLFFGNPSETVSGTITIEFNTGRKEELFIEQFNFGRRATVYIIYPNDMKQTYNSKCAFAGVANIAVCAPSTFDFYGHQTTTNASKYPVPMYKERKNLCFLYHTCKASRGQSNFIITSLLICLFI